MEGISAPQAWGGVGLSFGGLTASQPIIQSSSLELGSQTIPKESDVGSGLGAPLYSRQGGVQLAWKGTLGQLNGESKHPECRLSLLALPTCEGLFPFQSRTLTLRYKSV